MTDRCSENLLSRWSRRKQQAREDAGQEDPQLGEISDTQQNLAAHIPEVSLSPASEATLEVESDPVVMLTDVDMPPLESLTENSDFSGFMSRGVSDELRNLALRKMFKAASFNVLDGLDDYAEDYTSFEKLGDIVTSDMKHRIEMEASRKLEQEAEKLIESASSANLLEDIPAKERADLHLPAQAATDLQDEQSESELTRTELTPETGTIHE